MKETLVLGVAVEHCVSGDSEREAASIVPFTTPLYGPSAFRIQISDPCIQTYSYGFISSFSLSPYSSVRFVHDLPISFDHQTSPIIGPSSLGSPLTPAFEDRGSLIDDKSSGVVGNPSFPYSRVQAYP